MPAGLAEPLHLYGRRRQGRPRLRLGMATVSREAPADTHRPRLDGGPRSDGFRAMSKARPASQAGPE